MNRDYINNKGWEMNMKTSVNKKGHLKQNHTKKCTIEAIEKLIRQTEKIEAELNKIMENRIQSLSRLSK